MCALFARVLFRSQIRYSVTQERTTHNAEHQTYVQIFSYRLITALSTLLFALSLLCLQLTGPVRESPE